MSHKALFEVHSTLDNTILGAKSQILAFGGHSGFIYIAVVFDNITRFFVYSSITEEGVLNL